MSRMKGLFFVLVLVAVGFVSYKVGDKYGFEDGQRYGYGLDCRDDLENLKVVLDNLQKSLASAQSAALRYDSQLKSEEELRRARRYNELRPELLKRYPTNSVLLGIKEYTDDGEPVVDEKFVKCITGLGPCDGFPGKEGYDRKYYERLEKCKEGKLPPNVCSHLTE